MAISSVMHRKSVLAQTRFFANNNSFQPTIGDLMPADEQERELSNAEQQLKRLWAHHGLGGANRVSVKRLSQRVGLKTTYDYVYHLTSNYVHFNPTHLFKLGWGPIQGPFTFSVTHFNRLLLESRTVLGCYAVSWLFFPASREISAGRLEDTYRDCYVVTGVRCSMARNNYVRRNEPRASKEHSDIGYNVCAKAGGPQIVSKYYRGTKVTSYRRVDSSQNEAGFIIGSITLRGGRSRPPRPGCGRRRCGGSRRRRWLPRCGSSRGSRGGRSCAAA